MIGRRTLIAGLAAALLPARSGWTQSAARMPVLGVLIPGEPDPDSLLEILRLRLGEIGYAADRTIRLEIRNVPSNNEGILAAAKELVALKVDVIAAFQTPAVVAAKQATHTIPVVMAGAANPVETGLVESLARPGGNITGMAGFGAELAAKSVELLPEALPQVRRLAVLANLEDRFTPVMLAEIDRAARAAGLETITIQTRPGDDLRPVFAELATGKAQAVYIQPSISSRAVIALAIEHRLPPISFIRSFVRSGGLFAYASDDADLYREVAGYIDRVLRGAKPADLPVARARRFSLIVNLQTAKALGLAIPPSLLLRADEVIE